MNAYYFTVSIYLQKKLKHYAEIKDLQTAAVVLRKCESKGLLKHGRGEIEISHKYVCGDSTTLHRGTFDYWAMVENEPAIDWIKRTIATI